MHLVLIKGDDKYTTYSDFCCNMGIKKCNDLFCRAKQIGQKFPEVLEVYAMSHFNGDIVYKLNHLAVAYVRQRGVKLYDKLAQ